MHMHDPPSFEECWRGKLRLGTILLSPYAATFDHTLWGALSPPYTSRAPGSSTQNYARGRDSNAAQGDTQDTAKPIQQGVPGMRRSYPDLAYPIFGSDGHLPSMASADMRLTLVG